MVKPVAFKLPELAAGTQVVRVGDIHKQDCLSACTTVYTVHRAMMLLRHSILCNAADADILLGGEIELDESYFGGRRKGKRGRGAAGKVPVFGI